MKRTLQIGLALVLAAAAVAVAEEIKVSAALKVDNGYYVVKKSVLNFDVNQEGLGADQGVLLAVQTATNSIPISNVTTAHYAFFRNLDTSTSNSVEVTLTLRFQAGDVAVLPLAATNITYYTTNGNARFEYLILQK